MKNRLLHLYNLSWCAMAPHNVSKNYMVSWDNNPLFIKGGIKYVALEPYKITGYLVECQNSRLLDEDEPVRVRPR